MNQSLHFRNGNLFPVFRTLCIHACACILTYIRTYACGYVHPVAVLDTKKPTYVCRFDSLMRMYVRTYVCRDAYV